MAENDMLRRFLDAGVAFTRMTQERADAIVRDFVRAGEVGAEQASTTVEELVERSRENTERLLEQVRGEIREQVGNLGLATRDDIADLRREIAALRDAGGGSAGDATPSKAPASKAPARKAAARKAPARKAAGEAVEVPATRAPAGTAKKAGTANKAGTAKKAATAKKAGTANKKAGTANKAGTAKKASPAKKARPAKKA